MLAEPDVRDGVHPEALIDRVIEDGPGGVVFDGDRAELPIGVRRDVERPRTWRVRRFENEARGRIDRRTPRANIDGWQLLCERRRCEKKGHRGECRGAGG